MFARRASRTMFIVLVVLGAVARPASHPALAQASQQVAIQDFAFQPATLTILAGTTVTWTNRDGPAHTTTSDGIGAMSWDSSALTQGQSYSVTFTHPGTFTYHCSFHPLMMGTVVVQAAESGTPAATAMPTATPAATSPPKPTATAPLRPTPVSRSRPKHKSITIKPSGTTYRFVPATVTVKVGTRVTWSNLTNAPHTVTGRGGWKFASKMFTTNHSVSFTFKKAGSYRYYCAIHPSMKGTIIVKR